MTMFFRSLLLGLLTATLLLTACGDKGAATTSTPVDPGSVLGDPSGDSLLTIGDNPALADASTMAEAFAVARGVLFGADVGDTGTLSNLPGRRAFVCAYQKKPFQRCATGVGETLAASVAAASEALKAEHGKDFEPQRAKDIRLKIDVVTRTKPLTFKRSIDKPKKREIGMYGYWVRTLDEISYLLPTEILEKGVYNDKKKVKGMKRSRVLKLLRQRNPRLGELPEEFSYDRFKTIAWVEKDQPESTKKDIFRMYRLHAYEWENITADGLLQRSVWAADYLISSISAAGKIRYKYYVDRDRDSSSYNLLRHGGTTYSILQAYDRTKFEPYLKASEAAIDYLFSHCRKDKRTGPYGPNDGGESMFIVSPRNLVKLGGAGLALVMLDQYVEATGDTERFRAEAQAFGRFLVASQQKECIPQYKRTECDGEFVYFPSLEPGGPPTGLDDSAYYPGEAILGLVRLYAWDPNPMWLDTATRAADWLIQVRDKGKEAARLANDHWLMIGLSYLYLYTERADYLEHALKLARAVEYQYSKNLKSAEKYRDFKGGYYDPPRSTPAATRGEGLVAVLDICDLAGKDCAWIEELLHETVRHEILSQYDPDLSFWMRNKRKAFGGWNGGITDPSIRNDFVQHNMSSILGAERHIRKKEGVDLPGGPGWTRANQAGQTFPAIEKAEMDRLRADTLRYRGTTRWEDELAATAKPEMKALIAPEKGAPVAKPAKQ